MKKDNNDQINHQNPNSPTLEKTGNTNTNTNTAKLEYTVDEVIEQYVGSLGASQIIQVILVSIAWIFDAHGSLITIFSDVEPSWRCHGNNQNGTFDSVCQGKLTVHKGGGICGLKPGTWEWVNGPKSSTIAEWSLICDHKFLAAIPASCFFIGSLLGSIVYGRLADSILGRKKALMLACFLTGVTTFLTSFSPNVWTYAILRFSSGLARSGIGSCCLVLATEVIGRKWRGEVGQYGFFFYTVGFLSLPLMAYPTRYSWRNLYRIMSSFPIAYSIFILPFVVESPRWLLVRGRKSEAISILSTFAKRNGKQLPMNIELSDPTLSSPGDENTSNKNLWQCKWAIIRISKAMVAGFGVGFMYYGIQLNVENMNLSTYYAVGMNGLMEIPAVVLGGLLIGTTSRRLLFSISSYIAGVSCFLCIFFINKRGHNWGSWVQLIIEGVGFMTASMAYDVLYIYCVELFPTNVRNFAVSLLRQALMMGAAVAPLFVAVGRLRPAISFMVFGGLAIVSGLVSLWLPETKNAPLYETLEQQEKAEQFGAYKGSNTEIELELGENDNKA